MRVQKTRLRFNRRLLAETCANINRHQYMKHGPRGLAADRTNALVSCAFLFFACLGSSMDGDEGPVHSSGDETNVTALAQEGRLALRRGQDAEETETLLSAVKLFGRCAQLGRANAIRFYDLARAEHGLAARCEQQGDNQSARSWLDRAIADVKHALELDEHSADAHTLLADLYGSKIGLEGFWAAVRFGSKAESEAQAALRLNADNPRVQLTLGRRYLYSPKMFGGDLDRAIALFKKATTLDPQSDEAFRWLAIGWMRKGDRAQAKAALGEALRLNPRNRSTQRLLQDKP